MKKNYTNLYCVHYKYFEQPTYLAFYVPFPYKPFVYKVCL